jgi:hypothetical protein
MPDAASVDPVQAELIQRTYRRKEMINGNDKS